jgi:hypothetical protein
VSVLCNLRRARWWLMHPRMICMACMYDLYDLYVRIFVCMYAYGYMAVNALVPQVATRVLTPCRMLHIKSLDLSYCENLTAETLIHILSRWNIDEYTLKVKDSRASMKHWYIYSQGETLMNILSRWKIVVRVWNIDTYTLHWYIYRWRLSHALTRW